MPSKQTQIENKITTLSPSDFQKFCDAFLSKKFCDAKILGLGSKTGTLKTTIGNPDTYFRKSNGKYIFVVYTTQEKRIYEKILEDIEKCFDVLKTGVVASEIDLIIACHSTSTLSAGEDKCLHDYCIEHGVELDIYGTDEMARQICNKYRSIGKDFLGVEIDTNQILSKFDFICEYDRNPMAAPLNTSFVAREEDKENLINEIMSNSVTVVSGKAGTGKTRLVLEALTDIDKADEWNILCIKNRNLEIYTDLMTYLEEPDKYIVFVDDANEFSGVPLLIDFVNQRDKGYDVKVVATVRDYAKVDLIREISQLSNYSLVNIEKFSDEDITTFLDITFGIKNDIYVSRIIKIAEGNPRIAYMEGKLAVDKQSLSSIKDATGLYEGYYSSYIEGKIGEEEKLCIVFGLISVVKAVKIDNLKIFSEILNSVNITEDEFVDIVHRLSSMEMIDLRFDLMAMIADQCVANYMLYYTFFKKRYIDLNILVHEGFCKFRTGLIKFINTYLNIFNNSLSKKFMEQAIIEVWNEFEKEDSSLFWEYVKTFHIFKPEESFILVKKEIEKIDKEEFNPFTIDFSKKESISDDLLNILGGYKGSEYINIVLSLLDIYASKSEINAKKALSLIKSEFGIDCNSENYDFYGEIKIAELIRDNKYSETFNVVLLQYTQYMLGSEFRHSTMERGNSITMYNLTIHSCDAVKKYRSILWKWVNQMINFEEYEDCIIKLLNEYCNRMRVVEDNDLLLFDKTYIDKIITKIKKNNFDFAYLIRGIDYVWRKKGISCQNLDKSILETDLWQTYLMLENNFCYYDGKYNEYRDHRNKNLISFADALESDKVKEFINNVMLILENVKDGDKYQFIDGVQIIIRESCRLHKNEETFAELLYSKTDSISIYPNELLKSLFDIWGKEKLFSWLISTNNGNRNKWMFAYFEEMPASDVFENDLRRLLEYLKDDSDKKIINSSYRNMRFLDKFKIIDPDIYVKASKIILEKKEYSMIIVSIYFELLFNENVFRPEEVLNLYQNDLSVLQDIYFILIRYNKTFDYEGIFFKSFLKIDKNWAYRYGEYFYENKIDFDYAVYFINHLWQMDDSIEYFTKLFNYGYEKFKPNTREFESYFDNALLHMEEATDVYEKQKKWLLKLVVNYAFDEKIQVIFSLSSELEEDLRREMVKTFLKNNKSYEQFSKLKLESNQWSGTGSMIPIMQRRKEYLESLLPLVNGLDFLEHKDLINRYIRIWEERILREQMDEIMEHIYM